MTRSPPRAVLDTNVVVSALVFAHGRLGVLREAWQQTRFHPLVSTETTAELVRALAYPKFRLNTAERQELLADYLPYCTVVTAVADVPAVPRCRDPLDVPFLKLALVGKAACLVTGDQDLLGLKLPACTVAAPAEFARALAITPR